MPRNDSAPRSQAVSPAVDSEFRAYAFIKENLKALGWDTRNPARNPVGQVYTQNECLQHQEIRRQLQDEKPENVIKVSESIFWVVEAKRSHDDLAKAIGEAESYAGKINGSSVISAPFVSGVAGNDTDGYLVETRFLVGKRFQPITINGQLATGFLSPDLARSVLDDGPVIAEVPVDEKLFLQKAERINEILHLGAINKNLRARVMAALLLALLDDNPLSIERASPSVLIGDINNRAERVLRSRGKSEFYPHIQLALPTTEDNHAIYKQALVKTLQELRSLNIRSAMNSGADVLGKFYEVFLKYGNGAKEIGIVLTPRHITQFAAQVVQISDRDTVYDPCCGTGGFLVAAFDEVRKASSKSALNRFKNQNLLGVDQDAEVVALAITNMIFRGDGNTNIIEGNCFAKNVVGKAGKGKLTNEEPSKNAERVVSRVLMNPPFPTQKQQTPEYKFIDRALEQMQTGGILFSVLPYPTLVKVSKFLTWRRDVLLRKHTLLCVITFPEDLFYPVTVRTVGVLVKKGIPHSKNQPVLWIRALHDGLLKRKGKRLPCPREPDDIAEVRDVVMAHLVNPFGNVRNVPQLQKSCPIDFTDPLVELVPERYLDQPKPKKKDIERGIEQSVRYAMAFLVREGLE